MGEVPRYLEPWTGCRRAIFTLFYRSVGGCASWVQKLSGSFFYWLVYFSVVSKIIYDTHAPGNARKDIELYQCVVVYLRFLAILVGEQREWEQGVVGGGAVVGCVFEYS